MMSSVPSPFRSCDDSKVHPFVFSRLGPPRVPPELEMSQTAVWPLAFRHSTSKGPSPLKSPVPIALNPVALGRNELLAIPVAGDISPSPVWPVALSFQSR